MVENVLFQKSGFGINTNKYGVGKVMKSIGGEFYASQNSA